VSPGQLGPCTGGNYLLAGQPPFPSWLPIAKRDSQLPPQGRLIVQIKVALECEGLYIPNTVGVRLIHLNLFPCLFAPVTISMASLKPDLVNIFYHINFGSSGTLMVIHSGLEGMQELEEPR